MTAVSDWVLKAKRERVATIVNERHDNLAPATLYHVRAGADDDDYLLMDTESDALIGNTTLQLNGHAKFLYITNVYIERTYRGLGWCTPLLTRAIAHVIEGASSRPREAEVQIESQYPTAATICYFSALEANGFEFDRTDYAEMPTDTLEEYERLSPTEQYNNPWVERLVFVDGKEPPKKRTKITAFRNEMLQLATPDQYERIVARIDDQLAEFRDSDLRKGSDDLALGYGEVNSRFLRWLIRELNVAETDLFVDVGSGTGNVVAYIAAVTGADAIGVEVNPSLVHAAQHNLLAVTAALRLERLAMGHVQLIGGDATRSLDDWPPGRRAASVVFVNNLLFDAGLTRNIIAQFIRDGVVVAGTRLLLVKPLVWARGDEEEDLMRHMDFSEGRAPRVLTTPGNVVSWTSKPLYPVLYTATERSDDVLFRARHYREYSAMCRRRPVSLGER